MIWMMIPPPSHLSDNETADEDEGVDAEVVDPEPPDAEPMTQGAGLLQVGQRADDEEDLDQPPTKKWFGRKQTQATTTFSHRGAHSRGAVARLGQQRTYPRPRLC